MAASSHQDWKPLILGKSKPTAVTLTSKSQSQSTIAAANPRRLDEDEDYRIPQVDMEMGRKIVSGRLQMKLSQEQLAKKCSIPLAIIKDYEQGKGLYNRAYLDPICRLLNIVVSKRNSK
jgi:ribosome-binding protein aMBF1 (putative translation factor)